MAKYYFDELDYDLLQKMDYEMFSVLEYYRYGPPTKEVNPIEHLLIGTCDVYKFVKTKDENGVTRHVEELYHKGIKCRLSHRYWYGEVISRDFVPNATKQYELFVLPTVEILVNSKIVVTQNNRTLELSNTGIPSHYQYHNQIELIPFERWT